MTINSLKTQSVPNKIELLKFSSNGAILDFSNLSLFFKYINERHRIYKRRFIEKKSAPWTNDEILQKYKFTNIFRDLDPGTLYVIEKIIPNCSSDEELIFNIIIYRIYNKIETYEAIGIQNPYNFNKRELEHKLRKLKKSGTAVFTNAFTVSGYHWVNPNHDKISNTLTLIKWISDDIDRITEKITIDRNSEKTYKTLFKIRGIGIFLAYQIAVDIGYWNKDIFNEDIFVVAGPGCRRGIEYIFKSKGNLTYEDCVFFICNNQDEEFKRLGIDRKELFNDRKYPKLNAMAIENCFCEISKYLKAFYGTGRPRNRYYPKTSLDHFL